MIDKNKILSLEEWHKEIKIFIEEGTSISLGNTSENYSFTLGTIFTEFSHERDTFLKKSEDEKYSYIGNNDKDFCMFCFYIEILFLLETKQYNLGSPNTKFFLNKFKREEDEKIDLIVIPESLIDSCSIDIENIISYLKTLYDIDNNRNIIELLNTLKEDAEENELGIFQVSEGILITITNDDKWILII
jgi:hypothetical protein